MRSRKPTEPAKQDLLAIHPEFLNNNIFKSKGRLKKVVDNNFNALLNIIIEKIGKMERKNTRAYASRNNRAAKVEEGRESHAQASCN